METVHERLNTSLHHKFPHGQSHMNFDKTPLSANRNREDDLSPDDRPSTDQPAGKKPGSFLRKRWAEGKMIIQEINYRWRKNENFQ